MASEQFSLCWDNFHKNMSSGMNSLLENEDLVDVTLAVEGKYLKAHKMVLSVCSPYFRELFKVNPCKHPIVFMKDVSYVAMSDLLQFMYQGEVQVSQENLTTFIKTAEALQIKGLTGDGNGSAECDNDQDEPKPTDVELPKPTPRPMKKIHQVPTPPAKRPRLSAPEPSAPPAVTKTEPAAVSSASNNDQLIQFKMEPYDQGQSTVTIPDDNADETFTDDPLDETNADDGNEDYSMMEGGDEEPQAGTSADGTAGEGQVAKYEPLSFDEDENSLSQFGSFVSSNITGTSETPLDFFTAYGNKYEEEANPERKSNNNESVCSEDDKDVFLVNKPKKRSKNPDTWKRNIIKRNREAGKAYMNYRNQFVRARKCEGKCRSSENCFLKCESRIAVEGREKIFAEFWKLSDYEKGHFYCRYVKSSVPKRRRTKNEVSKRHQSFTYFFEISGQTIQVCKNFFLSTLDVSETRIYNFFKANTIIGKNVLKSGLQGKHVKKFIPEKYILGVKQHIQSFPTFESHSCDENSSKKYLSSDLNITRMYEMYKDSEFVLDNKPVKLHKYREIFNKDFNLGFSKPPKSNEACNALKSKSTKESFSFQNFTM